MSRDKASVHNVQFYKLTTKAMESSLNQYGFHLVHFQTNMPFRQITTSHFLCTNRTHVKFLFITTGSEA